MDRLGEGGMGTVYRGLQLSIGREVAIKVLHNEDGADDAYRSFVREARACSALRHPNVVQVYDFGLSDAGTPFLVMELVKGITLSQRLRQGPLAPREAVAITTQVCAGLQAAHRLGIVHADIKPSNIMVGDREGIGLFAQIVDFGIARWGGGQGDGRVRGSPRYMAPEQRTPGHVDGRADLWSLGMVLFQMLAGRHPFAELSTEDLLAGPPSPSLLALGLPIPAQLSSVTDHCLADHPSDRPVSAEALRLRLEAISLAPGPPVVHRPDAPDHLATFEDDSTQGTQARSSVVDPAGDSWEVTGVTDFSASESGFVATRIRDGVRRRFRRIPLAPGQSRWETTSRLKEQLATMSTLDEAGFCCFREFWCPDDVVTLMGDPLRGRPLSAKVAEEGALPHRQVLEIGSAIAHRLSQLHERGLVHGTLAPSTVRLDRDTLLLADPALASLLGDSTETSHPDDPYRAPEQLDGLGAPVGPTADLHALGVLLVTLATGAPPYGDVVGRPSLVARKLSPATFDVGHPELAIIVEHLLHPRLEDRARNAARVRARLDALLQRHPILEDETSHGSLRPLSVLTVRGRVEEHRAFAAALETAFEHERGSCLHVHGPAGSGRTALLSSLARDARRAGATVLSATRRGRGVPLGTVHALFADADRALALHVEDQRATILHQLHRHAEPVGALLRTLSPLFAELFREAHPLPPASEQAAHARLMEVLLGVPVWLSASVPLVLLVDDAHLADATSSHWLDQLEARVQDCAVVLVRMSDTPREGSHALGPLLEAEVLETLRDRLGAQAAETASPHFLSHTDRSPGAIVNLLRSALDTGAIRRVSSRWLVDADALSALPPPRTWLDTLADRVMALPDAAHPTLLALAAAYLPQSAIELGPLCSQTVDDTARALLMAADAELLTRDRDGRFAYRHPAVREAALSLGGADELQHLHQRMVDHLLDTPGAPQRMVRLARHLLSCSTGPDDSLLLRQGAEEALQSFDGELAATFARQALERAIAPSPDERAELMQLEAAGLSISMRPQDAAQRLAEAAEVAERIDLVANVAAEHSVVLHRLGRSQEIEAAQARALRMLEFEVLPDGPRRRIRTLGLVLRELVIQPLLPMRLPPNSLRDRLVSRLLLLRLSASIGVDRATARWCAVESLAAGRRGAGETYVLTLQAFALAAHVGIGFQHLAGRLAARAEPYRDRLPPTLRELATGLHITRQAIADGVFDATDASLRSAAARSGRTVAQGLLLVSGYLRAVRQGRLRDAAAFTDLLVAGRGPQGRELQVQLAASLHNQAQLAHKMIPVLRGLAADAEQSRPHRLRALAALTPMLAAEGLFDEAMENVDRYIDALADVDENHMQRAVAFSFAAYGLASALKAGRVPPEQIDAVASTVRMLLDDARTSADAFGDLRVIVALADAFLQTALGRSDRARKTLGKMRNSLQEGASQISGAELLLQLALLEGGAATPTGRDLLEEADAHARLADADHPVRLALDRALDRSVDGHAPITIERYGDASFSSIERRHEPLTGPLFERPPRSLVDRGRLLVRTHGKLAFFLFIGMSLTTHAGFFLLFVSGLAPASWVSGAGAGAFVASTIANRLTRSVRLVLTLFLTPTLSRWLGRRTPRSFDHEPS